MAALDFPTSPTNGQTYTANGKTWTYESATTSWVASNSVAAASITGTLGVAQGGTGATTAAAARTNLGAGTVTSVGGTGTVSGLTLSGTVTGSGNLTLGGTLSVTPSNFTSQTANTFLAAPNGAAGVPTFRAIVAADIPTLNQNTTGSAGSVANAVTFNNSGAGAASGSTYNGSGALTVSYNTVGAPSTTGANASGSWGISITGSSASCTGNAATATTATNQSGGTVNATTGTFSGDVTTATAVVTGSNTNGWGRIVNASSAMYFQAGSLNSGSAAAQPFVWTNMYGGTERMRLDASGNLTVASEITAFSDETLKTNWRPVADNFVEKLAGVKSGIFDRIDTAETQAGVGAQSLQQVLPEAVISHVSEPGGELLSVNYGAAALVSAVELAKMVVDLQAQVIAMQAKIDELQARG